MVSLVQLCKHSFYNFQLAKYKNYDNFREKYNGGNKLCVTFFFGHLYRTQVILKL